MNNQISFVTAFKKFKPPYSLIQSSALYSWQVNDIKIVASENEVGLKGPCSVFTNLTLVPGIKRARELEFQHQAPVVRDLIEKTLPFIETPMVALINSDIIIPSNFNSVLDRIFRKYGFNIFLAIGRQDIQLTYQVTSPEAYQAVQKEHGKPAEDSTGPYTFITSKFWWRKVIQEMPDLILGRYGWDNWIRRYAQLHIENRLTASKALILLHCIHGHNHIIIQEKAQPGKDPSSQFNAGLVKNGYSQIDDWKAIE